MKQYLLYCRDCNTLFHVQSSVLTRSCRKCRSTNTFLHFCNYRTFNEICKIIKDYTNFCNYRTYNEIGKIIKDYKNV